jgi:hypothetical protein
MKRSLSKPPFIVPFRNRVMYFTALHKWIYLIMWVCLIPILLVSIGYLIAQFPSITPLFKDPGFVGLFGALIGAFVGSLVGAYSSTYIQSQQLQADASISKRKIIYEPLYSDLISFRESLIEYPYPTYISNEPNEQVGMYTLKFWEWASINKDTRILQVPRWIRKALDYYLHDIETYKTLREQSCASIQTSIAEIVKQKYGSDWRVIPGEDNIILRDILLGEISDFQQHIVMNHILSIDEEGSKNLWDFVIEATENLEAYNKSKAFYTISIIGHLDWLIKEIARIIQYINLKFEKQNDQL